MNDQVKLPWFRQPLVWMVIAIPGSAVIVGFIMIYLASTTHDGLVVEDYYKHGLLINDRIERDELASELKLAAEIEIDSDSGFIKVVLDGGRIQDLPSQLSLGLRHATQQQNDDYIVLQRGIGNNYVGAFLDGIRAGIWYVELTNEVVEANTGQQSWRLSRRVRLDGFTRIALQADPGSGSDEVDQSVLQ